MKLTNAEYRFMNLLWDHEPISSGDLVSLCNQEFDWKKSTTYTFIKRLQERNIVSNENSNVIALIKREEAQRFESQEVLQKAFDNSLPTFVTAFLQDHKLSKEEIEKLKELLEKNQG